MAHLRQKLSLTLLHYIVPFRPPEAAHSGEKAVWSGGQQFFPGVHPQITTGSSHVDFSETPQQCSRRGEQGKIKRSIERRALEMVESGG